ncbi:MAG: class I SAM-dependent methyltransferase [Planctomycetota bacterium]
MSAPKLTGLAHHYVSATIKGGGFVIDATMGRGHDTLFLARAVGARGQVIGFDIQSEAIAATRNRLADAALLPQVELLQRCHSEIAAVLAERELKGCDAAMFNLGYLPRGDHRVCTETKTTLLALQAAHRALSDGGILAVLCYPGHHRGNEEFEAVSAWMESTPGTERRFQNEDDENSPVLFLKR